MELKDKIQSTEEQITEGQIMVLSAPAKLYEQTDEKAEVLKELDQGSRVFVTEQGTDWCTVWYDGNFAYIQSEMISPVETEQGLIEEMYELDTVSEQEMNQYLMKQEQKKDSFMWGSLTAILILLIFGMGIWNVIRQKPDDEEEDKQK